MSHCDTNPAFSNDHAEQQLSIVPKPLKSSPMCITTAAEMSSPEIKSLTLRERSNHYEPPNPINVSFSGF